MTKTTKTSTSVVARTTRKQPSQLPSRLISSVSMSNALAKAGHGLSLAEKRLIMMAISKTNSFKSRFDNTIVRTRISAKDYAETFQVDPNTAYEQIANAAKHLFERKITFYTEAPKRALKSPREPLRHYPLELTKRQIRWVGEIAYAKGEGWCELAWWPDVVPHLVGLQREFTTYKLVQASSLRSIYSWRLLEVLNSYKSGWCEMAIEDFAITMDISPKYLENFAKIRTKVIEPAVKELVEKDGWLITWSPKKQGRRVSSLRFEFKRNPQARFDF